MKPHPHKFRRRTIAWGLITAFLAIAWLRSHYRADRIQWFVRDSAWQVVSARGRIYLRYEDLGYSFPHWTRLTEVVRHELSAGVNYRNDKAHLGRAVDRRYADFEFARGADRRLNYWGYRETYGGDTQAKNPFWSVQAPDWFLFTIVALLFLNVALRFARRRSRAARGHCVVCDYDIRASTERCPECGEPLL